MAEAVHLPDGERFRGDEQRLAAVHGALRKQPVEALDVSHLWGAGAGRQRALCVCQRMHGSCLPRPCTKLLTATLYLIAIPARVSRLVTCTPMRQLTQGQQGGRSSLPPDPTLCTRKPASCNAAWSTEPSVPDWELEGDASSPLALREGLDGTVSLHCSRTLSRLSMMPRHGCDGHAGGGKGASPFSTCFIFNRRF
jgi:hypothetical protein